MIKKQIFGQIRDKNVFLHTLINSCGMEVELIDFGAAIKSIKIPDRNGQLENVVLGFDSLAEYLINPSYLGVIVGRCANRIRGASFELDGEIYQVDANQGQDHLHGGFNGFGHRLWECEPLVENDEISFKIFSSDGEGGYPGNLHVQAGYKLTDQNEIIINYKASTDKSTIINLTNHSYFNLAGRGDILNHYLTLHADQFTPVDEHCIPTGELRAVMNTPMDFTTAHSIGERIDIEDDQLEFGSGYDHNWVITSADNPLKSAARLTEPLSGRVLEVLTTEPGVQLYTGNFIDGSLNPDHIYRGALCLETQHFPDAPNLPEFPSIRLNPQENFSSQTVFRFSVD